MRGRRALVAVDASAVAGTVLRRARALARILDASIDVVHVGETDEADGIAMAAGEDVRIRVLDGDVVEALVDATRSDDVGWAALGCRGREGGATPAGHVAVELLRHTTRPILAVPPIDEHDPGAPFERALVPLDGTPETARAVEEVLRGLLQGGMEVIVAHVFDVDHVPAFLDQPQYGLETWAHEFLERHDTSDHRLVLRAGPTGRQLRDAAEAEGADLVVLAWKQDLSEGRAAVIRDLLGESRVPMLLVPYRDEATPEVGAPG